jgi:DNA mismatch repair protein MutS2
MNNLDWDEILERLSGFATSQPGRDQLKTLSALDSVQTAKISFAEIAQAAQVLALGKRPFMQSLDLYPLWQQRLSKDAVLKTLELRDVRHFCLEVLALNEIVKEQNLPWAKNIAEQLMDSTEPLGAIDQLMTPEGDIRNDASELLFKLFNEKNQVIRQTQNVLDRLIRQHEMEPVLQERYVTNREGRWVLPVRSGKQHSFEGIIHASSQSKQTVFMEPKEIIPLNNRLREIEVDIEDEIERLLRDLSDYLRTRLQDFSTARDNLLQADIRFAQAQLATHMQASACHFSDDELFLDELRHPLLMFSNVDVVANTVKLDRERRILLLSGPNAGGKTVLLKAVGLAAQMARCGLLVSAGPDSRLPFFKQVHVAIGDSQSVDQHLSTFAAHLKVLNQAAASAGPDTLLLIDEICGSTDPEEGTALGRAFIHAYARQGSFAVITSHLGPLKLGWTEGSGVINGSLEYDSRTGKPTYMFLMGVPGQSMALQTARRVGVNEQILAEAVNFLSPEMKRYHSGLEEIDKIKDELRTLREDSLAASRDALKEKSKYAALMQNFEREKERMLDQALRRAEKKIENMIDASRVDDVFKRHERLEQIKQTMPEIVKASTATGAANARAALAAISSAEDFAKAYPPGTKIFAPSIGRDGVVQSIPNAKGEVVVLSNSMRLTVLWSQLRPPQQASNPTQELARRAGEISSPLENDRQVDLRGKSLEEALRLLEVQLDAAALNQESRMKIVHGHGTDTLKKGIRNFLSRSVYVKKWKAGTPESGGDGITWAEIKD